MGSSFASVHFIGIKEINDKYIDLLRPHLQRKVVLAFLDLPNPEVLAVLSNNALSLFSEDFGVESINDIVCRCYKDVGVPIVTGGILDDDIVCVSIIQGGRIISNITLQDSQMDDDVYEEYKEQWLNCGEFNRLFGVSEDELRNNVADDMYDTLDNWAKILGIPINETFDSAKDGISRSSYKKYSLDQTINSSNAKIINIEDVAKAFEKFLNNDYS